MNYVEIPTHLPDYVRSLMARPPLPPPTATLDTACRTAFPTEVPPGVVTAFIGAPFFIWIVRRQRVREL